MADRWWDRLSGALGGGVLVALLGVFFVSADVERQTDVQFVNMALGILAEEVTDPVKQAPLREWAIDVINEHSAVDISGRAKERLLEEALRLEWDASRARFEAASEAWRSAAPAKENTEQAPKAGGE